MRVLFHRLTAAFAFVVSLIALSAGAESFTIRDGGYARTFELASDEVAVTKGLKFRQIEKTTAFSGAAGAKSIITNRSRNDERVDLVLYEVRDGKRLGHPKVVTGDVYFRVEPGANANRLAREAGAVGVMPTKASEHEFIAVAADSAAALQLAAALNEHADVIAADPILARQRFKRLIPNDTFFTNQFHLLNTGQFNGNAGADTRVPDVWDTYQGSGILIGFVDDGVDTSHPDLTNINTSIDRDFILSNNNGNPVYSDDDHGTACAGIATAVGNNGIGVSGAAPQAIPVSLRLISSDFVSDAQEAAAMNWSNGIIQIKSNSWGPFDSGDILEGPGPLTAAALSNSCMTGRGGLGTLHFWAGGNGLQAFDNSNFDGYANSIYTISISAADIRGEQAWYSEPGANHVVCASSSGDNNSAAEIGTWTTDRSGSAGYNSGVTPGEPSDADYTATFGGTSSATPLAAGIGALMIEANPGLGWRDVQEILIRSATRNDPSDGGWSQNGAGLWFSHKYGAGLINATGAVALAETWTNLAPQIIVTTNKTGIFTVIPDADFTGITRTFEITEDMRVEHVELSVNVTHPYRGDLVFSLTSPSGTVSLLTNQRGDNGNDYDDWSFMTVHNWGEMAVGTWSVNVFDAEGPDQGTLNSMRLTLYGTAGTPPSNQSPAIAFIGSQGVIISNSLSFPVTASDPIDGDPVTLSASGLPAGATFGSTNGTGTFIWPSAEPAGVYTSVFFAADKDGTNSEAVVITVSAAPAVSTNCGIIISEYVEGSSNNKAVEIYNGSAAPVDLAAGNYTLEQYNNGSLTPTYSMNLSGVIAPQAAFVIANQSASSTVTDAADLVTNSAVLGFNGNDVIVLKSDGSVVDSIGEIGETPNFAQNVTLRRKSTITTGDTIIDDTFDAADEWVSFAIDTFSGLGSHTNDCDGGGPVNPDSDFDGILDQWELDNFGSLTNANATSDFDLDFVSDQQEFLSGTQPTNDASFLQVFESSVDVSDDFVIVWPGVSGKNYSLTRNTNLLDDTYSVIASNIPGSEPLNIYTDTAPAEGSAVYRIEVE